MRNNVGQHVFWIWFPALGSSINAVSIAAGAEEAPLNTAWWLSTAALIATSFLTTLAFLREIKWRPIDRVLNNYVFTSWIVAGVIVIAWAIQYLV